MQLTEKQKSEGWRIVKFGDVAQEVKASTKDPLGEGIERYIGLEHIDPESLRLARYGLIAEDNPTFTKKFTAGDILFGRRRAYLKKAAVADFDGICSGDITVIAPKGEDLVPDLLPFIVQSEPFFDWAVKHSAGGLSPRTKFKSLAEFEFPLPPRPRQEEMLETLTRLETIVSSREALMNSSQALDQALIKEILDSSTTTVEYSGKELLDKGFISMLQDGNHGSQYPRAKEFVEEGFIYLTASNISESGRIDFESCAKLSKEKAESLRIPPAQGGDVILTHNATIGRTAIIPSELGIVVGSTSTTYYRPNTEKLLAEYLFIFMRSNYFQVQLKSVMKQTTRNQIPITAQKRLKFLIPGIEIQNKVLQVLNNTIKPSLKLDFVDKPVKIRREYIQKMLTEAA